MEKEIFEKEFKKFCSELQNYVSDEYKNWTVKGFIDVDKNVFTISNDTKIVSKILEIHIFPLIKKFADKIGFDLVLADCQNYYPDMSFVCRKNASIKYAVDIKTTYRKNDVICNGFTLGSHGEYFINRESSKNIQFPYSQYKAHYCLGIIYSRNSKIDETTQYSINELSKITSVIKDISFFFAEKWKIASDRSGSGNTANIGSIVKISDILGENGVFKPYSEKMFDDYWMNYNKIIITTEDGKTKKLTKLQEFLKYKGLR
jgi:hypothetical protein